MAEQFLQLSIVTPEKQMVSEQVEQVNIPGIEGDLGILYDHAPIITTMRSGQLSYEKGNEKTHLVVSGGYLEVTENRVIVLAETAEFLHEIDRKRAEAAKEKAESLLNQGGLSEGEFEEAQKKLFRAVARLEHSQEEG